MTARTAGLLAGALVLVPTGVAWAWGVQRAGGFAFGLDDPYIHLAIARELATRGEWGLGEGFVSGRSSPLWTALLALGLLAGAPGPALPVVYNAVLVLALGVVGARWLARRGVGPRASLAVLVGLGLAAPLPALLVGGMEHVLQLLLLTLWFAGLGERLAGGGGTRGLYAAAALLGLCRYESAFPMAVGLGLLAWRGERGLALRLGAVAAAGPLAFGAWSVAQGGGPVPNPVWLKGAGEAVRGTGALLKALVGWTWTTNAREPAVVAMPLLVVAAVGARRREEPTDPVGWTAAALVPAMLLHAAYARSGWFFRYEAWMVWVGGLAAAGALLPARPGRALLAGFLLAGAGPLAFRAAQAGSWIPEVVTSIRHQQVQTGQWLATWAGPGAAAVNDVGAVAWYAPDRPLVDLMGLVDDEAAAARRRGPLGRPELEALTAAAGVVAVYDAWFPEHPESWVPVARWRIAEQGACADRTVSFYATDAATAPALRASLDAWPLPVGVERLDPR